MIQINFYAIILIASFLFLLYAGLVKEQKDRYYGLLGGFFLLLMTGIIGLADPVSVPTSYETLHNGTLSTETIIYTPINNTLYYVFNITLILVSIGGLYRAWFENNLYTWDWIDNEGD